MKLILCTWDMVIHFLSHCFGFIFILILTVIIIIIITLIIIIMNLIFILLSSNFRAYWWLFKPRLNIVTQPILFWYHYKKKFDFCTVYGFFEKASFWERQWRVGKLKWASTRTGKFLYTSTLIYFARSIIDITIWN